MQVEESQIKGAHINREAACRKAHVYRTCKSDIQDQGQGYWIKRHSGYVYDVMHVP